MELDDLKNRFEKGRETFREEALDTPVYKGGFESADQAATTIGQWARVLCINEAKHKDKDGRVTGGAKWSEWIPVRPAGEDAVLQTRLVLNYASNFWEGVVVGGRGTGNTIEIRLASADGAYATEPDTIIESDPLYSDHSGTKKVVIEGARLDDWMLTRDEELQQIYNERLETLNTEYAEIFEAFERVLPIPASQAG